MVEFFLQAVVTLHILNMSIQNSNFWVESLNVENCVTSQNQLFVKTDFKLFTLTFWASINARDKQPETYEQACNRVCFVSKAFIYYIDII